MTQLRHEIDTAAAARTVWTFPSQEGAFGRGEGGGGVGRAEDGKHTGVRGGAKGEMGASAARKRSDVRYRQQRDAGDAAFDGERWKVTGGVRRGEAVGVGKGFCEAEMEFRSGGLPEEE